jgi:hypothetical protein
MERKMRTKFLMGLLAGAALLSSVAGADAKFIGLRVTDGSTTQSSSATFSGTDFTLTQNGPIGNVNYSISGISHEAADNIRLDLDTTSTNTANSVITVIYYLTVTDLTSQPTIKDWTDLFSGINPLVGGGPQTYSNASVNVFYDPANHAFAGGGPGSTATLIYSAPDATACGVPGYACSGSGPITLAPTPFSLTEVLTIAYKTNSAGQVVTANNAFALVPEPTSLALLGSGLLLAGFMFRRRQSDKVS